MCLLLTEKKRASKSPNSFPDLDSHTKFVNLGEYGLTLSEKKNLQFTCRDLRTYIIDSKQVFNGGQVANIIISIIIIISMY